MSEMASWLLQGSTLLKENLYRGFVSLIITPIFIKFFGAIVDGTCEVLHLEIASISRSFTFGGQRQPKAKRFDRVPVRVTLYNPCHFCWLLLLDEKIGLGDAYIAGDYAATPGVMELLRLLVRAKDEKRQARKAANSCDSRENLQQKKSAPSLARQLLSALGRLSLLLLRRAASAYHYWQHRTRDNTIERSRENIALHYDLGNDIFRIFLDPTMTYSCAIFEDTSEQAITKPIDSKQLEEAQIRKYDALLDRLSLTADDHVLEIGCGWGSCAIRAVERFGCKWTGLTTSVIHLELARQRVDEAGYSDRVQIELLDFRKVTGTFAAVVSIEMIEHVGHQFLPEYFRVIHDRLEPGGKCQLQAILCPDAYYSSYCNSSDFIRKHIFPGGHLPSLGAIEEALPRDENGEKLLESKIELEMPHHYVRTLDYWYTSWLARQSDVLSFGYSAAFHRAWQFYFALSSALFAYNHINHVQMTFTKRTPVQTVQAQK